MNALLQALGFVIIGGAGAGLVGLIVILYLYLPHITQPLVAMVVVGGILGAGVWLSRLPDPDQDATTIAPLRRKQ